MIRILLWACVVVAVNTKSAAIHNNRPVTFLTNAKFSPKDRDSTDLCLIQNSLLHQRFYYLAQPIKRWFQVLCMRLKHFNIDLGAQIFLACSDTSRLRILNLILINGEMCITDLEHILEFTQTKTSRHLLYLKNSGILTSRKINQWVFYQLKDEVFDITRQIFQFLRKDPMLQKDQQVFETLYSNRELSLNKLQIKPLSHL